MIEILSRAARWSELSERLVTVGRKKLGKIEGEIRLFSNALPFFQSGLIDYAQ